MEEFMKEYGGAVKRGAVIIAITVLILFICNPTEGGIAFGAVQNSIHEFLYKDECIRLISKVAGVKNRRLQMSGWSLTFTCCLYLLKGGKIKFE